VSNESDVEVHFTISPRIVDTLSTTQFIDQYALIREFVSNAYDADAAKVEITLHNDGTIVIEGFGDGMTPEEYRQFWEVGSIHKAGTLSPKFKRVRAGKYGFGKLSYRRSFCIFQIHNHKGDFDICHEVDEELFSSWKSIEERPKPKKIECTPLNHDGVKITLLGPRKETSIEEQILKTELQQKTQIDQPNFEVYLNGKKVPPIKYIGLEIPVDLTVEGVIDRGTFVENGKIAGSIHILKSPPKAVGERGILISVGGQGITRTFLGFDKDAHWSTRVVRIVGKLEVPWLHTSGGKTGFIEDYQYRRFFGIMRQFLRENVLATIEQEEKAKLDEKTSRVLSKLCKTLKSTLPNFPQLKSEATEEIRSRSGEVNPSVDERAKTERQESRNNKQPEEEEKEKIRIRGRRDIDETKKKLRRKFRLHEYGYDIETTYNPGDSRQSWYDYDKGIMVIKINEAHPMFSFERSKEDILFRYMARLVAQEITLIKQILHSEKAFDTQNKLLNAVVDSYIHKYED